MTTVFGIKNCDTVKKARSWLEQHKYDVQFHDFRTDGIDEDLITQWLEELGHDKLVNKRSTTWKQLTHDEKELAMGPEAAALIQAHPTLIKRPVLSHNNKIYLGFKADSYSQIFEI